LPQLVLNAIKSRSGLHYQYPDIKPQTLRLQFTPKARCGSELVSAFEKGRITVRLNWHNLGFNNQSGYLQLEDKVRIKGNIHCFRAFLFKYKGKDFGKARARTQLERTLKRSVNGDSRNQDSNPIQVARSSSCTQGPLLCKTTGQHPWHRLSWPSICLAVTSNRAKLQLLQSEN